MDIWRVNNMKIRIEIDENTKEEEVVIKCNKLSHEIKKIQSVLSEVLLDKAQIIFYKNEQEFYISLNEILFFETDSLGIVAHTFDDMYQVKYKLYELEKILPYEFNRVSKSTIVNIKYIYTIKRNITASSVVEFQNTHKKIYVSRHYYKQLKLKLMEKRRYYE